jgi:hypothetical protein
VRRLGRSNLVKVSRSTRALIGAALATALVASTPVEATAGSWSGHGQIAASTHVASGAGDVKRVTLRASRRFVLLGQRVRLFGRLTRNGRPLAGRLVRLGSDPYPFEGGFRTIAEGRTRRDGRFSFRGPPRRNTHFRAAAPALGINSQSALVYADYSGRERHSWRRGRLRMGFTIYAPFGAPGPPGGEKIHFYLTQNGQTTMPRVASTRMRRIGRGYMRGRAVARSRRPARGEHVWVCWRETPSDGFGLPTPLDPVCGDDAVTTPPPP